MKDFLSRFSILALGCLLATANVGCDSALVSPTDDASAATASTALQDAASELQALASEIEPGELWRVAAQVHDTLSDEQFAQMEENLRALRVRLFEEREIRQGGPGIGGPGIGGPGAGELSPRGPGAGEMSDLDLTEEQQNALAEIRDEYRPQIRDLLQQHRDGSIGDETFRTRLKALRTAMREALRGILPDSHLETLETRRAELQARRDAARAVRAEILDLTAEQEEQLDALHQGSGTGVQLVEDYDAWKTTLSEILHEEQLEIVIVHAALRAELRGPRMSGHGDPPRGLERPRGQPFGG